MLSTILLREIRKLNTNDGIHIDFFIMNFISIFLWFSYGWGIPSCQKFKAVFKIMVQIVIFNYFLSICLLNPHFGIKTYLQLLRVILVMTESAFQVQTLPEGEGYKNSFFPYTLRDCLCCQTQQRGAGSAFFFPGQRFLNICFSFFLKKYRYKS